MKKSERQPLTIGRDFRHKIIKVIQRKITRNVSLSRRLATPADASFLHKSPTCYNWTNRPLSSWPVDNKGCLKYLKFKGKREEERESIIAARG